MLLLAFTVFVFFIDVIRRATREGPRIVVTATSAPGLGPGARVWVAGRPVGRVLSVRFLDAGAAGVTQNLVIESILERQVADVIRDDAEATIQPSALLGPVIVSIDPGSPDRPPHAWTDTLRTVSREFDPDAFRALGDSLLRAGIQLRDRQRALTGLLSQPGTLQRLRDDPGAVQEVSARLEDLRRLMDVSMPASTLGRLQSDTLLRSRLASLQRRFARIDSLRTGREALARAQATLSAFQARARAMSGRVDRGFGTLGRGLGDGELMDQVALLRAQIDAAMVELRRDPTRWLRVRVF